jgi:hypothetical protein
MIVKKMTVGHNPVVGSESLMPSQVDELTALRAAILMFADSVLSDLRAIRNARTIEEAQSPVNGMIDRVNALVDAAETAKLEKQQAPTSRADAPNK